jgi:hypothetical protein
MASATVTVANNLSKKATQASFNDPTATKPETAIPFSITRNPRGVASAMQPKRREPCEHPA